MGAFSLVWSLSGELELAVYDDLSAFGVFSSSDPIDSKKINYHVMI